MNAVERQTSRQFWIWGFVFLFLLHAFAVFWFADRREIKPLWQKPNAFLFLSGDSTMDRRVTELAVLQDPTLFAVPHPHGFSGGAWLNFRPQVPTLNDASAPPEWLSLPEEQLGGALNEYIATNRPSEGQLLALLRATKTAEVRIPNEPVITNTTIRVEGPLASRELISVPPLPSAVSADVLRTTVVTVAVNGDGVVETASVVGESGSKAADDQAAHVARLVEFKPAGLRDARARLMVQPTLGRLVFTWHVVTNVSPTTASAR